MPLSVITASKRNQPTFQQTFEIFYFFLANISVPSSKGASIFSHSLASIRRRQPVPGGLLGAWIFNLDVLSFSPVPASLIRKPSLLVNSTIHFRYLRRRTRVRPGKPSQRVHFKFVRWHRMVHPVQSPKYDLDLRGYIPWYPGYTSREFNVYWAITRELLPIHVTLAWSNYWSKMGNQHRIIANINNVIDTKLI